LFKKVKLIVIYINTDAFWDADTLLPKLKNTIIAKLQHEWVHVEQMIRSKKLKSSDKGIDTSDTFFSKDIVKFNKHQKALFQLQDSKYLKEIQKTILLVIKKKIKDGIIDKNQLKIEMGTKDLKEAIMRALDSATNGEAYYTRKSEIHAFAVNAAELFIQGDIVSLETILMNYIAIGVESKKVRNKFFRLYSEALQERGLSPSDVSEHVKQIYSQIYPKVKQMIMATKQEVKEYLKEE